jgi:hypothetical protein
MFSLESLYVSMVKKIEDIRYEIINAGQSTNMSYYAWDSRGSETELPNADLIGLIGWTFEENEGLPAIQMGILVSLVMDKNQFREVKILDTIRNNFVGIGGDYKCIPLLTPSTGVEYSQLQVSNFEIMPAGRSEVRSTRNVGVEFLRVSGD